MSELSAYELAHRISTAKPQQADAVSAKAAFVAAGSASEELSDDPRAASLLGPMRRLREVAPEGVSNSAIVYASAFVLSGTEESERSSLGELLIARQVLALASHKDRDGSPIDLKSAIQSGGLPREGVNEIRNSVFNSSHVDDAHLSALSGSPLFSSPSEQDELFASKVLSSERSSLADDPLALRASLAVEALDVDSEGSDARRISSSLARISHDGLPADVPVPDLAVRIASDVAAQARAERLSGDIGMDETEERAFRIHEAAAQDPAMAEDLGREAKGLFHEMSRGSMIELRSDMETGANLPDDMVRFIRLSAERLEGMNRDVLDRSAQGPEVEKEVARMPMRVPEHEMGM